MTATTDEDLPPASRAGDRPGDGTGDGTGDGAPTPGDDAVGAPGDPVGVGVDHDRRRFWVASAIGGALATLLFAHLLTLGTFQLTQWQRVGDFYDAQARSWLDGRWDIAPETLGIERFEARGRSYMYQPPVPALLRVPVVAVTERFDGRMTQPSMLLGFVVAVVFTARLHWRIRGLVRGAVPVGRTEQWAIGAATLVVTGGSALLYAASRAWVYHEAIVWGVAFTIGALDALVACATGLTRRRIAWAALLATLAICSRSSIGLGAVAGLGVLAGGQLVHAIRALGAIRDAHTGLIGVGRQLLDRLTWAGPGLDGSGRARVPSLALATVTPVAVYASINWIKFRSLFSVPFDTQGFTLVDPDRQAFLAEHGGTLFGTVFTPTTVVQYLRPDALSVTRTFPFVDFPANATPFGDVTFDLIDRTSSIPSSMPALVLLAVVGLLAIVRGRPAGPAPGTGALRTAAIGGAAGALTILPFGYIAHRYLADTVPLLAVSSLAGLHVLLGSTWPSLARFRRPLTAGLVVLGLATVWINLSLALVYQRLYSPNVKDDVIAGFVDTAYSVGATLGLDPKVPLTVGDRLPPDGSRGQLFAIGDCDALYLSDGMDENAVKITDWNAVERTEAGGRFLRTITFPDVAAGTVEPLAALAVDGEQVGLLTVDRVGGDGVVFDYRGQGEDQASPIRRMPPGQPMHLDLEIDPHIRRLTVWVDGVVQLETYVVPASLEVVVELGALGQPVPGVADTFSGTLEPLPERTGVCQRLRARADR